MRGRGGRGEREERQDLEIGLVRGLGGRDEDGRLGGREGGRGEGRGGEGRGRKELRGLNRASKTIQFKKGETMTD